MGGPACLPPLSAFISGSLGRRCVFSSSLPRSPPPKHFTEEELQENFIRGADRLFVDATVPAVCGGAGGQAVAKTNNCVQLTHVPTGIMVRCHATRSREQNRVLARRELQLRLDDTIRGAGSVRNVAAAAAIKATGRAHSRARARHALIKEQKAAAAAEAAAAAAAASVSDADAPLNGAPAASTPAAPAGGARGGGVEAAVLEVHAVAAKAPPKAALR